MVIKNNRRVKYGGKEKRGERNHQTAGGSRSRSKQGQIVTSTAGRSGKAERNARQAEKGSPEVVVSYEYWNAFL